MNCFEYRIQSGDTLSAIARRHEVAVEVLTRLNGISDVNRIWAGQVLRIPRKEAAPPLKPKPEPPAPRNPFQPAPEKTQPEKTQPEKTQPEKTQPQKPVTGVARTAPPGVLRHLEEREGRLKDHQKVYIDTRGYATAGMGHKLTSQELTVYKKNSMVPLSVLEDWAKADVNTAYQAAVEQAALAGVGNQEFINALTCVNFQLGTYWYKSHKKTWACIKAHQWEQAATEAADSAWYKQTPARVNDFQAALRAMTDTPLQAPGKPSPPSASKKGPDVQELVRHVHDAMAGIGTDEKTVYANLAKLNHDPVLIAEFKRRYKATYQVEAEDDLEDDFSNSITSGNELDHALSYLRPLPASPPKTPAKTPPKSPSPTQPESPVSRGGGNAVALQKLGQSARKRLKLVNLGACARGVCEQLGEAGYRFNGARPFVSTGIAGGTVYDYSTSTWVSSTTQCAWVSNSKSLDGTKLKKGAKVKTAQAQECAKYMRHTLKLFKFVECTPLLPGNGKRGEAPAATVQALHALPEGAIVVFGPALSRSMQAAAGTYSVGGHGHAGHIGVLVHEGKKVLVLADGMMDVETAVSCYAWAIGFLPTTEPLKLTRKELPARSL